ncbi:unnamed protein product [Rhodiola kirilowii]
MDEGASSKHRTESEQRWKLARRKKIRQYVIIAISSVVLVGVVIAAVIGTHVSAKPEPNKSWLLSLSSTVKAVCNVTLYKDSCYDSLMSSGPKSGQPDELFNLSMLASLGAIHETSHQLELGGIVWAILNDTMIKIALENCKELLGLAMDHVNDSMSLPSDLSNISTANDLKTWLSAAGTYHETCRDGFEFESEDVLLNVSKLLKHSAELASNSLAIANWLTTVSSTVKYHQRRRLLSLSHKATPEWIGAAGVRRLMSSTNLTEIANITVAKDGTGMFKNISAALEAVLDKRNETVIIYVKKGAYVENARVEKNKWNVIMIGDGSDKTIVTGSLNVGDGTPTFSSATFAVFGKGFMARDMGFENTAGSINHQAVALMSAADKSTFYRCRFDSFEGTLYAHSNRQFYRDCDIYGTVDFIFGNSAVVLQNCNIMLKTPIPGQHNTITAQGKSDPNMNTGTSVHNCTISPFGNLTNVNSYLGRPWKNYSTTIFMTSTLSNVIDPKGWLAWNGASTAPETIFYAEYMNEGMGGGTGNRVNWPGLHVNVSKKVVDGFTVRAFLQGDQWIPSEVPHNSEL